MTIKESIQKHIRRYVDDNLLGYARALMEVGVRDLKLEVEVNIVDNPLNLALEVRMRATSFMCPNTAEDHHHEIAKKYPKHSYHVNTSSDKLAAVAAATSYLERYSHGYVAKLFFADGRPTDIPRGTTLVTIF